MMKKKTFISSLGLGLVFSILVTAPHAYGDSDDDFSGFDRVLQSVQADLGSDGQIVELSDTTVAFNSLSGDGESDSHTYNPSDTADQLPVRVLVSYVDEQGNRGFNLSELEGTEGRVRIDVTVQNMTVKPQVMSFDSHGVAIQRNVLVGAPLTVTAAANLEHSPSEIITSNDQSMDDEINGEGAENASTNGVVSLTDGGDSSTVQWATILAPPQLSATATFTLVVNSSSFHVPDFHLNVQPGYISSVSSEQVLASAFGSNADSEEALIARTIELTREFNEILTRTGDTVAQARSTLELSANTIGSRTINDLESSARAIVSSSQKLVTSLDALEADLQASLGVTENSVYTQLSETTKTLKAMVGDTTTQAPVFTVNGDTCEASVEIVEEDSPENEDSTPSVYETMLTLSAYIDGYAQTTDTCRAQIKQNLVDLIGTTDETLDDCADSQSLTCSLLKTENKVNNLADSLTERSQTLSDDIAARIPTSPKADDLGSAISALETSISKLSTDGSDDISQGVSSARTAMTKVQTSVNARISSLSLMKTSLTTLRDNYLQRAQDLDSSTHETRQTITNMVDEVCNSTTLTTAEQNDILVHVTGRSCDGKNLYRYSKYRALKNKNMEYYLDEERDRWNSAATAANRILNDVTACETDLAKVNTELTNLDSALNKISSGSSSVSSYVSDVSSLSTDITTVRANYDTIKKALDDLEGDLTDLPNDVKKDVDKEFETISKSLNGTESDSDSITNSLSETRNSLDTRRQEITGQTDRLLNTTIGFLEGTSDGIAAGGKTLVENSHRNINGTYKALEDNTKTEISNALNTMGNSLAASTGDAETAHDLLHADIMKVLADIGANDHSGTGLLGAMHSAAGATANADLQIAMADTQAVSFGNLQRANLHARTLRSAQTSAVLDHQESLQPFMVNIDGNTRCLTTYALVVRGK